MRSHIHSKRSGRRAVAMVETAMVISVALLFLFGIFEYARFVYVNQVMFNAAQTGARYAVAHTGDGTTLAQVQAVVNTSMAGIQYQVDNFTVNVNYVSDSTGATVSGSSWNNAPFGSPILVQVSCNYHPMLPTFLSSQATIPIVANAMMSSEAN